MDSDVPSVFEFYSLLYKILSFKSELKTEEIEILLWKFYSKLTDKQIGKLMKVTHQRVNFIYQESLEKIRISESTALPSLPPMQK
jgi:DNA-directed RNA polymerase sigma subunit (sigma70/sigma32)